jgi:hypothetical protein
MTTLNTEDQQHKQPPSDVVWGLSGIAAVLNCPRDRAAYLARAGYLGDSVKKIGNAWVGSRRKLLQSVNSL